MSERDILAAEYALGLLEGEEQLKARGLLAADPEFAASVTAWEERLAPLLGEVRGAQPPADLWPQIQAAIRAPAGNNVIELKRRLGIWKGLSAAASAIAASLALVVAFDATRPPPASEMPGAPIMVASLMSQSREVMLSAAFEADGKTLTIMPGKMAAPSGRAFQLWVVPSDGKPRSLGLVSGKAERMAVSAGMAQHFHEQPMLVLSVEPMGSAPATQPSGPMIASGQLRLV